MPGIGAMGYDSGSVLALTAPQHNCEELRKVMVGVPGLEPGTSTSRTWRAIDCSSPNQASLYFLR